MGRKHDDEAISAFIDELAGQPWLGKLREPWPRHLFHITDVRNAARILVSGTLLCRAWAVEQNRMVVDNASSDIIEHTDTEIHTFVRLYFRPRTPTFYHNEGIRPINQRSKGSHCPVPIALIFDSKSILGMQSVRFCDGGYNRPGRTPNVGDDVGFLRDMDFTQIYHSQAVTDSEGSDLVHRRHSEVHVPWQLSLDPLRYICARSSAERETLRTLISHELSRNHTHDSHELTTRIRVTTRGLLFNHRWSYVEKVSVHDGEIQISFNPNSLTPGPFEMELDIDDLEAQLPSLYLRMQDFSASLPFIVPLPSQYQNRDFRLTLWLDDSLAYVNDFDPTIGNVQLIV